MQVDNSAASAGLAVLYDSAGAGSWAMNQMSTHIYLGPDHQHFLHRGTDCVGEVTALHNRHDVVEVSLVRNDPFEKTMVQVCLAIVVSRRGVSGCAFVFLVHSQDSSGVHSFV